MRPMICMFPVPISIGKFDTKVYSSSLLSPAEAQAFLQEKPLKNGSSHTDGASIKMPQYPSPMFS